MQSNPLLRRYIDIVNERVVIGPDGKPTGGLQPSTTPRDPNSPEEIQRQARIKRRQDAEAAEQSWLGQAPKGYGWGGRLPANLKPADVERVLAGENPDQIFTGRSQRGMFGPDATQHKAMAQQWLDWQKTAPPKYDPLADIDNEPANEGKADPSSEQELQKLPKFQRVIAKQDLPPTSNDRKSGAFKSDVAVTRDDPKRVQVAPNVEKKVYDYQVKLDQAEKARQQQAMDQHPIWSSIGKFGGDIIGGARARWDALTGAGSRAIDQQTGYDRYPDPVKPVDIIPNPPKGTATPRESAQDHLARMRAVVAEAEQFKGVTNQGKKSQDMMKEYKPKD